MRHNELQECTRISIWTPLCADAPKPPTDEGTPPNPQHKGNIPHITYIYPQNILMHRKVNE